MTTETTTQAVILAGGQGTRFWPISRMKKPKQFLSISENGESLLQATVRRIAPLIGEQSPMILTNVLHKELVYKDVPRATVISEPIGRNTAASIGLAAIHIRKSFGDGVMVVLPADHSVADEGALNETISRAVKLATEHEILVTIGIHAEYPNTGYGYIRRGIPLNGTGFMVRRFFEKPNYERALEYCKSGEYYWNSGMFVWRASVLLEALEELMPQLYNGLIEIENVLGTTEEDAVTKRVFEGLESVSVDFGVLELARNCAVVPAQSFGWNDVGSWEAWASHFSKDAEGNLLHGDAVAIDSNNCVAYSAKKFMAVVGCEDIVAIDSGDAVLVCPREKVQDVRKVVEWLKNKNRTDLI